ncbi:MucR family transcriptional regulator [Novosphingobium sp. BL-52-GroH]|uniref:MucR family transcriptional regulator n=1 Tax=Novosphingobium sp. BL-52-GroH TaxID=3349877 RepID=UPI003850961B
MADTENPADLTALTVELLSAYLANNTVGSEDLPRLIRDTRLALSEDTKPEPVVDEETFTPAVSIRKSQSSSAHLLSLIDGKPYKTLKRHLAANGLTPETYRERYKLPANYPMVAPDFAAKRRAIAEQIGLGNRRKPAVSHDNQKSLAAVTLAASSGPAAESKPLSGDTSAVTSPGSKDAPTKLGGSVAKAKRNAAPEPAKTSDVPVVTAPETAKATSVKPIASKANAKPKSGSNSGSSSAAATAKKRAATKGTKPEAVAAMPAPIAAAAPPAASAPAPKPADKPRGKLGLFGKGQATSEKGAPTATGETSSKPVQADKPGMARSPKAATNDAG